MSLGVLLDLVVGLTARSYKRATAIGLQQAVGNSAGFVSGQILLYITQYFIFRYYNAKRERMTEEEKSELIANGAEGDAHPDFRYPK